MRFKGIIIVAIYLVLSLVILSNIPPVQQLGTTIRLIIFHGMLSMAGLYTNYAAGILGGLFLLTRREAWGRWSERLGLYFVVIWIIGTALSFVSMQVAWGGIVYEPLTVAALTMVVLGLGKEYLVRSNNGTLRTFAIANAVFAAAVVVLRITLSYVQSMGVVLHPDNPIGTSDSVIIRLLPMLLLVVTLLAIFEFARWQLKQRVN
ncbi:hypothetical protein [Dethiobacter alkaliphilus]|uniref:DUF2306 domain-containing protein n=1 Tax=Dethiobacter alkaliphilus AHT 1 TaxID=555088 RepID=C0GK04_DETAL|nr:hypothetical protein [Dethiobacter alkaliphilus]EEG76373.1 hypothetical protein DealDRAFT_2813 [Dethiobacter alkaliphilus AHT 1]MCW3489803.1 hypothetical protein [Dethiobacter alkaliphilus]